MRIYARMYARAYDCQDTTRDTGTLPEKRGIKAKHKNKICDCWAIYTQTTKKS